MRVFCYLSMSVRGSMHLVVYVLGMIILERDGGSG